MICYCGLKFCLGFVWEVGFKATIKKGSWWFQVFWGGGLSPKSIKNY